MKIFSFYRCFCLNSVLALSFVSIVDFRPALAAETDVSAEAQAAYRIKNYPKVIEILSPRITELGKSELILLGKSYSDSKNSIMAQKVFLAALSKSPNESEIKALIGRELFFAGKDNEALSALKETIDKDKNYLPAYQFLVPIFEKKKNKYELRLLYQDMVERFGQKYEFLAKLCELTTQDSHYELAKKYCELAIKINPREANNSVYLGIAHKDTGERESAEKVLKKTADSFSKSEFSQITFAEWLFDNKNYIEAYKYFQRAVSANPKSEKGLLGVGRSGVEVQKLEEALVAFVKLCKLSRTSMAEFRRAASSLKHAQNELWLRKFEAEINKCD